MLRCHLTGRATTHLVIEMRTSSPQRLWLWAYAADGAIASRSSLRPERLAARSIPLQYFKGMDKSGTDLASAINRRTDSFWMSVWGPFGELNRRGDRLRDAYPLNRP